QSTLAVPVDRDRLLNQRLARNQLDVISRRHVEGLECFVWRERWRPLRDLLNAGWPGTIDWGGLKGGQAGYHDGDDNDRAWPGRRHRHLWSSANDTSTPPRSLLT